MTRSWLLYFRSNQAEPDEIPWLQISPPAPEVARVLVSSLQQFQLGEGATGLTFLELGRRHAEATGDLDFVETLALFIAEEQRHSALLARYLRAIGAAVLEYEWVDGIFRRLRKLAGLECMVTVLVTAEIVSIPYYRAVYRMTSCPVLSAVCLRILREEAQHLLFQAVTLNCLRRGRPQFIQHLVHLAHMLLLTGTSCMVWLQHGEVMRRGGFSFARFLRSAFGTLTHVAQAANAPKSTAMGATAPTHR